MQMSTENPDVLTNGGDPTPQLHLPSGVCGSNRTTSKLMRSPSSQRTLHFVHAVYEGSKACRGVQIVRSTLEQIQKTLKQN